MKVIPFEEKYRQDFINFNIDWIISNFGFLEEHDKETFEKIMNISEEILPLNIGKKAVNVFTPPRED